MKNLSQFLNFAAVARHGSFAQAARELSLAPSSVAKSVARLEQELGVRLFHRTTRSVQLTGEGQQLFAKCSRLLDEIEALDLRSVGENDAPSGTLRIGAPIGYGTRVVLPLLANLQRRFPALEIDLRLSDEQVDLLAQGLDAAIRFGALRDSGMIARQFDAQDLLLCASPEYLASHTRIRRIADLSHHVSAALRMPTTGRNRPLEFCERGKAVALSHQSRRSACRSCIARGRTSPDACIHGAPAPGERCTRRSIAAVPARTAPGQSRRTGCANAACARSGADRRTCARSFRLNIVGRHEVREETQRLG